MNNRSSVLFFALPLALFSVVVAILLNLLLHKTGGRLIYVIDDPYIHLSIARHLVEHGVWGVSIDHFTNTSSSPLWTLLLAPFMFFPSFAEKGPLILNLAAVLLLVIVLWNAAQRAGLKGPVSAGFLFSVLFLTPLFIVVFTGMEHVLHTLLVMLFAFKWADTQGGFRSGFLRTLLVVCLVLTRVESLFVIAAAVILLFDSSKGKRFMTVAMTAALPLLVLGVFSLMHGGLFFPNSVALKGNALGISSVTLLQFLGKALKQVLCAPHLLGLMVISLAIRLLDRKKVIALSPASKGLHFLFLASSVLHLLFAQVGWFYRYEAYLMVLGFSAIFLSFPEWEPFFRNLSVKGAHRTRAILFSALVVLLLSGRAIIGATGIPLSAKNIYEQQYQIGLFLRQCESGRSVVLNDIGAASFLGNVHVIDLWGLGHDEIARMRKNWRFRVADLEQIISRENGTIAVVYDDLFFDTDVFKFAKPFFGHLPFLWFLKPYFIKYGIGVVPGHWIKVAEWEITDNIVCESGQVSFYAFDPPAAGQLLRALKGFEADLPKDVVKTYYRTE